VFVVIINEMAGHGHASQIEQGKAQQVVDSFSFRTTSPKGQTGVVALESVIQQRSAS